MKTHRVKEEQEQNHSGCGVKQRNLWCALGDDLRTWMRNCSAISPICFVGMMLSAKGDFAGSSIERFTQRSPGVQRNRPVFSTEIAALVFPRPLKERYNRANQGWKKEIPSEVTADTYKHYGAK